MKKFLVLCLVLAMLFLVAGCIPSSPDQEDAPAVDVEVIEPDYIEDVETKPEFTEDEPETVSIVDEYDDVSVSTESNIESIPTAVSAPADTSQPSTPAPTLTLQPAPSVPTTSPTPPVTPTAEEPAPIVRDVSDAEYLGTRDGGQIFGGGGTGDMWGRW